MSSGTTIGAKMLDDTLSRIFAWNSGRFGDVCTFFPNFFPLGLMSEILLMEDGWLESSEGWL